MLIFQSCDPHQYARMLRWSGSILARYSEIHGLRYESTIGILRGKLPWHASYNRIELLQRFRAAGYRGWVGYFDVDAIVTTAEDAIPALIAAHVDRAAIFVHTGAQGAPWFDINNGIFFLNLGHPSANKILSAWSERWHSVPDDVLAASVNWGESFDDDQYMLQKVLREHESLRHDVVVTSDEVRRHTRQVLRAEVSNFEQRLMVLAEECRSAARWLWSGDSRPSGLALRDARISASESMAIAQATLRSFGTATQDGHTLSASVASALSGASWKDIDSIASMMARLRVPH